MAPIRDYSDYHAAVRRTSNVIEVPYHHPVLIPRSVRPVIAAHLAYRRIQGAEDDDLLFAHPDGKRVYALLRSAITSTLTLLHQHQPPWMHRDPCRHGADAGLLPRAQGWLIERGLSMHRAAAPERSL